MNPAADLPTVEQPTDLRALLVPYRPYSLDWLNRLRLGEVDFMRPPRLDMYAALTNPRSAGRTDLRCA